MDDLTTGDQTVADFDSSKFGLGSLCLRSHDYQSSGKSLRYRYNMSTCVECERARQRRSKKVRRPVESAELRRFITMRRNNRGKRQQEKYTFAQLTRHFERFAGSCGYCGASVRPCEHCNSTLVQWDHFDPEGIDGLSNLVPACGRCNLSKLNRTADEWFPAQPFYTRVRDAAIRAILSTTRGPQGRS